MSQNSGPNKLNSDQRLRLILHTVDRVTSFLMLLVKAAAWVAGAFAAVLMAEAIAGKQTNFDLSVNANANFVINLLSRFGSEKYAWIVAILGVLYGLFERKLRQRKTEYLQDRITKLEKTIDLKRESSGLTPRGETNEGDRL